MGKVLITESFLSEIAGAIRSKNGTGRTYKPGEMAQAIREIEERQEINLQSKTATQNGTVTPDTGYDGLSHVVVDVSPGESIPYANGLNF